MANAVDFSRPCDILHPALWMIHSPKDPLRRGLLRYCSARCSSLGVLRTTNGSPLHPDRAICPQNALAAPLILFIAAGTGELAALPSLEFPMLGLITLGVSCVAGLAMNFFSWRLRELLSATSVTVVGALTHPTSPKGRRLN